MTFFVETDIIDKEFSGLFKFALDESANQAFSTAIIHNGNIPLIFGGIAQLARVLGSYPIGRRFESHCRYHVGASFVSLAPIFCKNQSALTPLLLLCAKSHADCGYALINAGMMPPLRYQLFVQIYRSKMGGHLFCYRLTRRDGLREHNPVRISGRDFLSLRYRSFSARKLGCALVRKLSLFPCSFCLLSCKSSVCGLMFLSTIYTAALE